MTNTLFIIKNTISSDDDDENEKNLDEIFVVGSNSHGQLGNNLFSLCERHCVCVYIII
jgi:hypothetical protein